MKFQTFIPALFFSFNLAGCLGSDDEGGSFGDLACMSDDGDLCIVFKGPAGNLTSGQVTAACDGYLGVLQESCDAGDVGTCTDLGSSQSTNWASVTFYGTTFNATTAESACLSSSYLGTFSP